MREEDRSRVPGLHGREERHGALERDPRGRQPSEQQVDDPEVSECDSFEGAVADLAVDRERLDVPIVGGPEIARVEIQAREVRDESPLRQPVAVRAMDGHCGLVRGSCGDQVSALDGKIRERPEDATLPELVATSPVRLDRATEELGCCVETAFSHRDRAESLEHGPGARGILLSLECLERGLEPLARAREVAAVHREESLGPVGIPPLPERPRLLDVALRRVDVPVADVRTGSRDQETRRHGSARPARQDAVEELAEDPVGAGRGEHGIECRRDPRRGLHVARDLASVEQVGELPQDRRSSRGPSIAAARRSPPAPGNARRDVPRSAPHRRRAPRGRPGSIRTS